MKNPSFPILIKISKKRALIITVDTNGKRVPMVLIDDGSALNICPLKIASCLGLNIEDFVPSNQYVRAYDNN